MSAVAIAALSSLCAAPMLPAAYTAHLTGGECHLHDPACAFPQDNRTTFTDGKTAMNHHVHRLQDGKLFYKLWSTRTPHSHAAVEYTWLDGQSDCQSKEFDSPIQADWAWLEYNTTVDGGMVPCPGEPNSQCQLFSGPWPEQLTRLVQLWLKPAPAAGGLPVPFHLEMTAAPVPLIIKKNYTHVAWGMPPDSELQPDPSCSHAKRIAAAPAPRTLDEVIAARRLGPYTELLRRAIAEKWDLSSARSASGPAAGGTSRQPPRWS